MTVRLTAADRDLIRSRGASVAEVERQIELLRNPPGHLQLQRPCTIGDGVVVIPEQQRALLIETFRHHSDRFSKLVPASGAATRMFALLRALADGDSSTKAIESGNRLVDNVDRLPFAAELLTIARGQRLSSRLVPALIGSEGLDLARLPKALVPFHRYRDGSRTASVEHLYEAARHCGKVCTVHFTVSAEHQDLLEAHLEAHRPIIESAISRELALGFSTQSSASDTLAVDENDEILRDDQGKIVFRPGGHGALLENLEGLTRSGGDLVFIKNIDNIMPDHRHAEVADWKRVLGGYLLHAEQLLRPLVTAAEHEIDGQGWRQRCITVLEDLGLPSAAARSSSRSNAEIRARLGRPLRICGAVENRGHPGGGPFWIRNNGEESVQIVETAQIDLANPEQRRIVETSTHFNPVDLVCSLRDFNGTPLQLDRFVDQQAVFIAAKTHRGRRISALERPGLWNGAMADWNTIFVEVPAETFAPVKTVFDLLGPDHQPLRD